MLNPVQTAEEVASLDIMSEGRVVFGIGIGYRDVEYEAFGMTSRERVPRMLEALDLIKRLWTEEVVTHEGRFFRVHDATCTIRPVQKPFPPIWIAANADPAVLRTARMGLSWFINPHAALPTIERQWQRYKQALAEANHPMPAARPIALELHVAPTHEEAVATARPFLEAKYAAYAEWGQDKALPGQESFRVPFDDLARDRFVLGTPDEVIEQIEERVRRLEFELSDFPDGLARHGIGENPAGHRPDGPPRAAVFSQEIRSGLSAGSSPGRMPGPGGGPSRGIASRTASLATRDVFGDEGHHGNAERHGRGDRPVALRDARAGDPAARRGGGVGRRARRPRHRRAARTAARHSLSRPRPARPILPACRRCCAPARTGCAPSPGSARNAP